MCACVCGHVNATAGERKVAGPVCTITRAVSSFDF